MEWPKYRAWILGKMWEVRGLDWIEDDIFITTDGGFMQLCEEDDVYLLEFTGLKDKNGVEIYEGDIVRNHLGTKATITFEDATFLWGQAPLNIIKRLKDGLKYHEVIGNIYSNPDLLEVK